MSRAAANNRHNTPPPRAPARPPVHPSAAAAPHHTTPPSSHRYATSNAPRPVHPSDAHLSQTFKPKGHDSHSSGAGMCEKLPGYLGQHATIFVILILVVIVAVALVVAGWQTNWFAGKSSNNNNVLLGGGGGGGGGLGNTAPSSTAPAQNTPTPTSAPNVTPTSAPVVTPQYICDYPSLCSLGGQGQSTTAVDYTGGVLANLAMTNPSGVSSALASATQVWPGKTLGGDSNAQGIITYDLNCYALPSSMSASTRRSSCNQLCASTHGCNEAALANVQKTYSNYNLYGCSNLGTSNSPTGSSLNNYPCILRGFKSATSGAVAPAYLTPTDLTTDSAYLPVMANAGSSGTTTLGPQNCQQASQGIQASGFLQNKASTGALASWQKQCVTAFTGNGAGTAAACLALCQANESQGCTAVSYAFEDTAGTIAYDNNGASWASLQSACLSANSAAPTPCVLMGASSTYNVEPAATTSYYQLMLPTILGANSC